MAELESSKKTGGKWVDRTPGAGSTFNDCHSKTVTFPQFSYESNGEICHYWECELNQRRCFDGMMTPQMYVEIFEDTYVETEIEELFARTGAYMGAGGVVLAGVGAIILASNPVGWVVGLGLGLTVAGTVFGAGGGIVWIESSRGVYRFTKIREVDTEITRTGFTGKYTLEITGGRVIGNPSADLPCEEIPESVRAGAASDPVRGCLDEIGTIKSVDEIRTSSDFARGV